MDWEMFVGPFFEAFSLVILRFYRAAFNPPPPPTRHYTLAPKDNRRIFRPNNGRPSPLLKKAPLLPCYTMPLSSYLDNPFIHNLAGAKMEKGGALSKEGKRERR